MEKDIEGTGVSHAAVYHTQSSTCHLISTFIHHTLTPEREAELARLLEELIFNAVNEFVG